MSVRVVDKPISNEFVVERLGAFVVVNYMVCCYRCTTLASSRWSSRTPFIRDALTTNVGI